MYLLHLDYSFIHPWTFGFYPVSAGVNLGVKIYLRDSDFNSFEHIYGSGVVGLHGSSVFNFWETVIMFTILLLHHFIIWPTVHKCLTFFTSPHPHQHLFLKILFIYPLERGRERKERERKINVWLPLTHPSGDLGGNPDVCPDWKSKQWLVCKSALNHWATPARAHQHFLKKQQSS